MDFHVFLKLCENGSEQEIIDAINGGADVNARDNNGRTALMYASQGGRSEAVKELIEAGADVNAQNNNGETALMYALFRRNFEAVKVLIEAGADVNVLNNDGKTALMYALFRRNFEVAKVLIEAGTDVNARDNSGWSALMYASDTLDRGNFEAVKVLIEAGADVNAQNNNGWSALMYASRWGCSEAVKVLIEAGADVNVLNNDGETALMYALDWRNFEAVKVLIEAGADVNVLNNDGETALMNALDWGNFEAVKVLIEAGADVNARDNSGWSALMYASDRGNFEAVKVLIEAGADVNAQNNNGWSALMYASRWGCSEAVSEAVKVLIEAGADVNSCDWANSDIIKNLLEIGDVYADSDKDKAVMFYTCAAAGKLDPYYEDVYSLKVRAMRRIAEIYDEAGDIEKAVEWYSKFSEDEDGEICLYNLDKFYSIGEYNVRCIAERLAELYYEIGRKAQSVRYYNKLNFQHDDEIYEDEVVRISCEIAAECKDDTEAAKWYEFSISYGRENDEAAEKISLLAKNGNGYAQCLMAEYFCDRIESLDWYQKAVKNGCCARAYYGIGMIALGGLKDDKEAAKYFYESLKSSAGNYPVNTYSDLYEHSYYSIYSYSFWDTYKGKALEGLLKIVEREQKSPVLPHYAETLVMELISTDSDILEVIKSRYERSNSEHSAIFQNMLGVIYSEDLGGVEVDFEEAASWYRRAAENGHVEAMYALAEMYEEGRGVERDIDEAVKWYREASERGHLTAKTMLDKINNSSETVILEKEPETDTVEDDEDENAENEDNGIEMKQAMKAEAVERMKLLGLPEKIINEFQEKSVIYISESVKYGEISEVYRLDKNDILFADIKEFEKEYRGSLVYHVIRDFNGEGSYGDIDSFLNVFPEPSEWDYVKKVFKTKKILMDVYAFNRTIPEFSDYGEILVEAKDGGLLRMS